MSLLFQINSSPSNEPILLSKSVYSVKNNSWVTAISYSDNPRKLFFITLLTCFLWWLSKRYFSSLNLWGITHQIHPVTKNQCWCIITSSAINYTLRNSWFPTYMNHYGLYHQYPFSLPIHCHCLIKSIPLNMMIKILVTGIFYQYQMIILSCRYLSLWNSMKPCPLLICHYMQYKVPQDNGKLISKEYRYSPNIHYPKYIILIWKFFSWVP